MVSGAGALHYFMYPRRGELDSPSDSLVEEMAHGFPIGPVLVASRSGERTKSELSDFGLSEFAPWLIVTTV